MSDRARALGLHSGAAPIVARGEITEHHVAEARRMQRLGWGWQTIAHLLAVNRDSLRAQAEVTLAPRAVPPPTPDPRLVDEGPVSLASNKAQVLLAMARGVGPEPRFLAAAIHAQPQSVACLRDLGLVGQPTLRAPWFLTPAGDAEVARLRGLQAARLAPGVSCRG